MAISLSSTFTTRPGLPFLTTKVFWSDSDRLIQVTTDKSLYQAKDQITVSVRAPSTLSGHVIVDLSRDGAVLWTGGIGLHNHRGFTVIPYAPEFKGELTLAAYSLEKIQ